jgi:hypothetical protein
MTPPARSRVTQRVTIDDLPDLATNPPRAALAFSTEHGPECVPAVLRTTDRLEVGVDRTTISDAGLPDRATLVVDDGRWWFELRAIVRRGALHPVADEGTGEPTAGLAWFAFETRTSVAWDYGALHEDPA